MLAIKTDKILRFTQDDKQTVILNEVKNLGVGNKNAVNLAEVFSRFQIYPAGASN